MTEPDGQYPPPPQQLAYQYPPEAPSAAVPPLRYPPESHRAKAPAGLMIAFAAVAVVFLAVGIGVGVFIERPTPTTTAPATGPNTFYATGILNLTDPSDTALAFGQTGAACMGTGGYSDINRGAQVVVYDAAGKSLAISSLDGGTNEGSATCQFVFRVNDIPSGVGPYSVQVSHRGMIAFTEAQALTLELSLGS